MGKGVQALAHQNVIAGVLVDMLGADSSCRLILVV